MDYSQQIKRANKTFMLILLYMSLAPITMSIVYIFNDFLYDFGLAFQLIYSTLFCVLVPTLLFTQYYDLKILDFFEFNKVSIKNLLYIFLICLCIQPVMSFLSLIGMIFTENYVDEVAQSLIEFPYFIALLAIAITPAICEELLMRGVVLKGYEGLSLRKMAIINGLFFGIIHGNLQQFFYAAVLGFVFVYFVKLTGSIFSSIFAHFIINGSQITMAYFAKDTSSSYTITYMDYIYVFIYAIPFLIVTLVLMKKFIKNNKETYDEIKDGNIELNENAKIFDKNFVIILLIFGITILVDSIFY